MQPRLLGIDFLGGRFFAHKKRLTALQKGKLISGSVNFILEMKSPNKDDEVKDLYLKEALLLKQAHSLCCSLTNENNIY